MFNLIIGLILYTVHKKSLSLSLSKNPRYFPFSINALILILQKKGDAKM